MSVKASRNRMTKRNQHQGVATKERTRRPQGERGRKQREQQKRENTIEEPRRFQNKNQAEARGKYTRSGAEASRVLQAGQAARQGGKLRTVALRQVGHSSTRGHRAACDRARPSTKEEIKQRK